MFRFRGLLGLFAMTAMIAASVSVFAAPKDNFDRLDGFGPSRAKVDVIEWEDNLEVHAEPMGKLLGLGAKIDDRTPGKKILVIGFRMQGEPSVFVRRADLAIPLHSGFKLFKNPSAKGYEKWAFSNQELKAPWVAVKMDKAPGDWYPEGHEGNQGSRLVDVDDTAAPESRIPAAAEADAPSSASEKVPSAPAEDGQLKPYTW
jgi:hypothetical protein